MKKLAITLILPALLLSLGCQEKDEVSKVFAAQKCLNDVDETNSAAVLACADKLGSLTTNSAQSVRCKILLTAGGINSTRMIAAFDSQEESNSAAMMINFSFNTAGDNKALVKDAQQVCQSSGDRGLIGLSTFASMGTLICNGSSSCDVGSGDPTDKINKCINNDGGNTCTGEDKKDLGVTAELMGDQYCSGDNTNQSQCSAFESAKTDGSMAGLTPGSDAYYQQLADNLMGNLDQ